MLQVRTNKTSLVFLRIFISITCVQYYIHPGNRMSRIHGAASKVWQLNATSDISLTKYMYLQLCAVHWCTVAHCTVHSAHPFYLLFRPFCTFCTACTLTLYRQCRPPSTYTFKTCRNNSQFIIHRGPFLYLSVI